jgi:hypothetical protein
LGCKLEPKLLNSPALESSLTGNPKIDLQAVLGIAEPFRRGKEVYYSMLRD